MTALLFSRNCDKWCCWYYCLCERQIKGNEVRGWGKMSQLLSWIDRLDKRASLLIFNLRLGFYFDVFYTFPGIAFGVPLSHGIFLSLVVAATQHVNGGTYGYFWFVCAPLTIFFLLYWVYVIKSSLKIQSEADIAASIRERGGIYQFYRPRAMVFGVFILICNIALSAVLCDTLTGQTAALR